MIKQRILDDLKKAVKDLGFMSIDPDKIGADIVCNIPKNPSFGDYSTNVALQLAKIDSRSGKQPASPSAKHFESKRGESPMDIAKQIVDKLKSFGSAQDNFDEIKIAGGGFINFFLKDQVLIKNLQDITDKKPAPIKSGPPKKDGEKVMVEFTDPNPFKEFHIGHVFSNAVGESLSRLFEYSGYEVKRVNYFGDVGMHVAKSIWGLKQKLREENLSLEDLEKRLLKERIEYLGQAYVKGAKAYEEDAQEEIKRINLLIYIAAQKYMEETTQFKPQANYQSLVDFNETDLREVRKFFEAGRKWSLDYFEEIYQILGTKFDGYYPESIVGEYGLKEVRDHLEDKVFEKSEGAVIFPAEKYGLHNRVFINSLGLPTYEAKELGLALKKHQDYEFDRSIIVTGNEINEYFKVLMLALQKIQPENASKTTHIGHGMVRMIGGKMSSRTGNVLTFNELYQAVKTKIEAILKDVDIEEKEHMLNVVAVGAIKFAMLKHQPTIDTIFDLDKSAALEGDSGPYVQYTYARAKSILRKGLSDLGDLRNLSNLGDLTLEKEERQLLAKIEYFSGVVEEATESLHPNLIATYLLDLASDFNLFYQKHRIIDAKEDKKELRLALTSTVSIILKQGLYLLGIDSPERM